MWQQVMLDLFMRIAHDLEHALEGLTVEDLHAQPGPASNSIAWLAWHLTSIAWWAAAAVFFLLARGPFPGKRRPPRQRRAGRFS